MRKRKTTTSLSFFLLWIVLVIVVFFLLRIDNPIESLSLIIEFVIALNCGTFILYCIDKLQAIVHRTRIPERILILSAFLGGPIGALLAMWLVRHKTRKTSFQVKLFLLVALEVGIIYWILNL